MQSASHRFRLALAWLLASGAVAFFSLGPQADAAGDLASSDAEYRRKLVGTWEDDYQGHRTLTVRADGTATMIVKLHGWKATLYASQLQFEMTWSIEAGRLRKHTTSGEPAGRVKAILGMMGDRVDEQIVELTPERLLLLDQNGKKQYDWRRVKPQT